MPRSSLLFALALLAAGCIKNLGMADGTTGGSSGPATTTTTTDPTGTSGTNTSSTTDPTTGEPVCGNGEVESDEQCDDGNNVNGDGCENNCTKTMISETCGDGIINDASEECDDANDNNNDACTNACKKASCGDGIVYTDIELCDDGAATATCDADCTLPECGDGVTNTAAGEECDDMNVDNTDACLSTCKKAYCGDHVVQAGVEECDDGTPDGDDLCNQCKVSPFRYIFVTKNSFNGDMTGVQGADANCLFAADAAGISGDTSWSAWLSQSTSLANERIDTSYTGWYVLPTDPPTLVAKGWAGLTSGTLLHAIDHTETGEPIVGPATAWTNTDIKGDLPTINAHCISWNNNSGGNNGRVGHATATNGDWTDPENPMWLSCDSAHRLYCVQGSP